jgi:hypothetical protein
MRGVLQLADMPADWVFLQWFRRYGEAADMILPLADALKRNKKLKGYLISEIVQWPAPRGGFALYAIPPLK